MQTGESKRIQQSMCTRCLHDPTMVHWERVASYLRHPRHPQNRWYNREAGRGTKIRQTLTHFSLGTVSVCFMDTKSNFCYRFLDQCCCCLALCHQRYSTAVLRPPACCKQNEKALGLRLQFQQAAPPRFVLRVPQSILMLSLSSLPYPPHNGRVQLQIDSATCQ